MAKKDKIKNADRPDGEKKEGGKLTAIIFILLILFIWLTGFAVLIKLDVGSLGTTLRPFLKDVPGLNLILPLVSDEQLAYENNYPFTTMEEAIAKIDELQAQLDAVSASGTDYAAQLAALQTENARLKVFEDNQVAFEARVAEFDQNVVFNNLAPDVSEYRKYYEEIEPANAEKIYQLVLQLEQYDEGIATQATLFATMKPQQAADTLQEMTADIEWIVKVMLAMKTEQSTEIMNKMDPLYVAKIMQRMSDINEEKLQTLYDVLNQ